MNKGWIIALVVILVVVVGAILLTSNSNSNTDIGYVADQCLRGNQYACNYHASLLAKEEAEKLLQERIDQVNFSKDQYLQSISTPVPEGD